MRIREDVLERDYCLAWFLSALSESELRQVFAFRVDVPHVAEFASRVLVHAAQSRVPAGGLGSDG
jgi:hypothetical protein